MLSIGEFSNICKVSAKTLRYYAEIDVQLVEIAQLQLLSVRKLVQACDYPQEYSQCFGRLFRRLASEQLTSAAPPMVLFHSSEFTPFGLNTEFAIPVKEYVTGTRIFHPGLCLKTTVNGDYSQLPAVYARHREWMEAEGYTYSSPLYEVYVTDPVNASSEQELITEVYSPIKKKHP